MSWYMAQRQIKRNLLDMFESLQQKGMVVTYQNRQTLGFPFYITQRFNNMMLMQGGKSFMKVRCLSLQTTFLSLLRRQVSCQMTHLDLGSRVKLEVPYAESEFRLQKGLQVEGRAAYGKLFYQTLPVFELKDMILKAKDHQHLLQLNFTGGGNILAPKLGQRNAAVSYYLKGALETTRHQLKFEDSWIHLLNKRVGLKGGLIFSPPYPRGKIVFDLPSPTFLLDLGISSLSHGSQLQQVLQIPFLSHLLKRRLPPQKTCLQLVIDKRRLQFTPPLLPAIPF
jgi:hypothetical protein